MADIIQITKVPIGKVKPNPKNPRVIRNEKFKKLVASLQEFPQMFEKRPLVCCTDKDGNLVVLGGNMRLKAAKEVGLTHVPVMMADDFTEEQKDEFLIKDNSSYGEWDLSSLSLNFKGVNFPNWGVDVQLPTATDFNFNATTEQNTPTDESEVQQPVNTQTQQNNDIDEATDEDEEDEYEQSESLTKITLPTITVEYASMGEKDRLLKFLRQFDYKYKIN